MRRLTRYILAELLKFFAVSLFGMTALVIVGCIMQEAVRFGFGPATLVRMTPYMAPNALRFAIPGTILLATCCVFGRMSSSNEVVAVRSLGISPITLIAPALVLAFLLSLATVWVNDLAVTWGREGVHRVVLESIEKIVYGMLQTQRSYATRKMSINVKRVEGRRLIRPTITIHGRDGQPPLTLMAQEAELRRNEKNQSLSLVLTNGVAERGSLRFEFHDTIEHDIPLAQASKKGEFSESPSECPLARIPAEIARQRQEIQQIRQALAAEAAYQMMAGDFAALSERTWFARRLELENAERRLCRLQTEPWRRWGTGFSCLFFVLVGAPLAIQMRNSDLWTTFGVCFLPILLVYYPLLMLGTDLAKTGAWPPYSVWLGNVLMLVAGLWLLRRVTTR